VLPVRARRLRRRQPSPIFRQGRLPVLKNFLMENIFPPQKFVAENSAQFFTGQATAVDS